MSASSAVPRCHGVKGFSRLLAIATHFRITDGSAASSSRPTGWRKPSAATCATRAANNSIVSSKWVKP